MKYRDDLHQVTHKGASPVGNSALTEALRATVRSSVFSIHEIPVDDSTSEGPMPVYKSSHRAQIDDESGDSGKRNKETRDRGWCELLVWRGSCTTVVLTSRSTMHLWLLLCMMYSGSAIAIHARAAPLPRYSCSTGCSGS